MRRIAVLDPERNTDRIFGRQGGVILSEVVPESDLWQHPKSGLVYSGREMSAAWRESRNSRPVICAGQDADIAWPQ